MPQLDDSDFHEQNQKAKKEISSTLEKLHAFDREQTNALKTAEQDLETMQKYITRLEKMYTGPKIEITGYQKGSILKPDENEINGIASGLQGKLENAESSPMEIMLEKLNKNEGSNVDTVAGKENDEKINQEIHAKNTVLTDLQKELAKHPEVYGDIRVIGGKLYNHKGWKKVKTVDVADEVVQNPADIKYIGGRYHVYENNQIVREYIVNGKVKMEVVEHIPDSRSQGSIKRDFEGTSLEPVNDIADFAGKELTGGNDALRVITGKDPDTDEKVSGIERVTDGIFLTPVGRLLKYGKKGFKLFKGEEAAKKVSKVKEGPRGKKHSKWWHPGYVDNLSPAKTILGVKKSPKGLSTLGSSTRQNAVDAGKGWVGNGAKKILDKSGNFIGYKSADGMRAFRLQYKPKEKMWRANFTENEITVVGSKTELRNVHVDILD
ncbi:T7SS effector LXG polymorphic toxin [Bacillus sp. HSf4]|uniref:T7SS effector LXG polymorphic toxin n=1 Tax=Bacillus sp. HSf4 TaxID=3035514 RepID=UPI0024090CF9|nr:T7SS effector LXG polymorphic toxin [Bacillus sp. HSf4]WFA05605.1 T7SS effector LXG polymorphic toxin [Bacillus sp. HSf4]